MRRRLIAAVAAGCAAPPALHAIEPSEISALGGDELLILGDRLVDGLSVRFGAAAARELTVHDEGFGLTIAPPGLAGEVDVTLVDADGQPLATLPAGLRYLPVSLAFVAAGEGYLPVTGPLRDGRVGDLDGDGVDDLIVLDDQGAISWWRGTGGGSLTDEGVVVDGAIRAMALGDLDGDGHLDLVVCSATAEAPRALFGAGDGGFSPDPGALPLLPGACDALAVAGGAVGVLRRVGTGSVVDILEPVDPERPRRLGRLGRLGRAEPGACPISGPATCAVAIQGAGTPAATLTVSGPATLLADLTLDRAPAALDLQVLAASGVLLSAVIVDATGERFIARLDPTDPRPSATDPERWAHDGDGVLDLPIRAAGVAVDREGGEGTATIDTVRLRMRDGALVDVLSFDVWPSAITLDRRHHHLALGASSAGALDMIVGDAATDGTVRLYVDAAGGWSPAASTRLPAPACGVGDIALAPLTPSGGLDLLLSCQDRQNRLMLNDGSGRWFDDTARALPVDAARSAGVDLADLDRDGVPELLIATRDGVDRLYGSVGDRWVDRSARLGLEITDTRRMLALDIDGDGDLDIIGLGAAGARLHVAVPDGVRDD